MGDKFRSLWGKEAGWAHSVLFTADLRAFSERLSMKTEEVQIKREEETTIFSETHVKTGELSPRSVKREHPDEDAHTVLVEQVTSTQTIKRRRRK